MNTHVHTSSREAANRLAVARVAAAGRLTDARRAADARRESYAAEGQMLSADGTYVEWCLICGRATDHTGEHTPEQIAAWRA